MRKAIMGAALAAALTTTAPITTHSQTASGPNWAGLYAGLDIGARDSSIDFTTSSVTVGGAGIALTGNNAGFENAAFRGGGFVGYNWVVRPLWVAGVELDAAGSDSSITKSGFLPGLSPGFVQVGGGDKLTFDTPWDLSLRGRAGYLVSPSVLVYGTVGIAVEQVDGTGTCVVGAPPGGGCAPPVGPLTQKTSDTPIGWTLGAGIEAFFTPKWTVRGEYRYADYGTLTHATTLGIFGGTNAAFKFNPSSHTFALGLAYKFD